MNSNDLALFENLICAAYSSTDQKERQQASDHINKFTQFDFWKQNLFVLKQSRNPYALHFAANNLRNALTDYVTSFTPGDRSDLRTGLLSVFADTGDQFWASNTVRPILVDCFCRLQKLCWFDTAGPSMTLITDIMPFLQHSIALSIIGINLLQRLVVEMSETVGKISYAMQRKIAVLFREKCLHEILKLGLQSLQRIYQSKKVAGDPEEAAQQLLTKETLELISQSLSFDFIGTTPDNTTDDIGVIHVPDCWASIFEDRETLQVVVGLYDRMGPPYSTKCLEILEKFSGVRNSIFRTTESRNTFLNVLIDSLGNILTTKKDLDQPRNVHQLSRLLVRLKGNYQLKHLLETNNYAAFIQKVAEFTVAAFQQNSFHAIYYLFSFWSRMVAADCLLKTESGPPTHLKGVVPMMIKSFVAAQLEHAGHALSDDLLDNEHLQSVLGEILGISKINYTEVTTLLLTGLEQIAQNAQPLMNLPTSPQLIVAENQLAWMVYIATSVLGGKSGTGVRSNGSAGGMGEETVDEEQTIEGQLLCCLFECLAMHDKRLQIQPPTPATARLELAFVLFLQKFCRLYLTEASVGSSNGIYEMLAHVDLGDTNRVIERVVQKVIMLLKMWPQHLEIIEETLGSSGLFWSLATGWGSSKLMGRSPLVSHLLEHHAEVEIPSSEGAVRTRVSFYRTLSRLLFGVNSTTDFYAFVIPFQHTMDQIKIMISQQQQLSSALKMLTRVLSDLQGVVSAIYSKDRGYIQFFNWFYHDSGYYEWLVQLLSQSKKINLGSDTCWAIMKFADELSSNQHRRVVFPVTSADGIRLFRSTAHLLIHFANFILSGDHPEDADEKYKSFKLYLRCLHRSLTGGYTNFGVFDMYNDPIVNELLKTSCTIIFLLDPSLLEMYPKVFTLVFSVLGTLATNHSSFLLSLDQLHFGQLLRILLRGLHSTVKEIISECCSTLDKLFTLHVNNLLQAQQNRLNPRSPSLHQIDLMSSHIAHHQNLLNAILIQLLNLIVTLESVHWFVSKPLLALIFVSQKDFAFVKQLVVNSQAQDEVKATKVAALFGQLMADVKATLDTENREKFTSNVTSFRVDLKGVLDLNSFYKAIVQYTME